MSFITIESEKEIYMTELTCFHTKLSFKDNALGIGLAISRIPRTGALNKVNPGMDFVSLRAFSKEGVRGSMDLKSFFCWLPLYFGENKDRTLHLAKKALSQVFCGNTKRFEPKMVLDMFPKILITVAYQLVGETRHPSIRLIRLFVHIHSMFVLFLEEFP